MTKTQVMALLRSHKNERGIAHWKKRADKNGGLKSFGIGLTQLRKLSRQIGRDHKLAQQLFKSDVYDAKVVGMLIDEPKKITREQVEQQVEALEGGMLVHVFTSCGSTLGKAPFAFELSNEWMSSKDEIRRRCGYALLFELSKKGPEGMDDAYCKERIARIEKTVHGEPMWVRESMMAALMRMGMRNKALNKIAIRAARKIGPVDIDYGDDNSCEPVDVLKHLTGDTVQKRLSA